MNTIQITDVLTVKEAMEFVRRKSHSAFQRFTSQNKVFSCGHGLYRIAELREGLQRAEDAKARRRKGRK